MPEQTDDPNMESFYCPICNDFLPESTYLKIIFKSENTKWFANMITHYRHHHITSWNKNWEKNGHNYRNSYHFGNYHEEKNKINERAKRQIIKKCKDFIIEHNFEKDDFLNLYYNEDKTIELISKIFR